MSSKVLLIYGAGANVGGALTKKFSANGWKTAAVVRTLREDNKKIADLVLQADFADAEAIQGVYSKVESELGTPSCVVYNAYSYESFNEDLSRPFSAPVNVFARDLAINTVGLYAAAASASAGFAKLGAGPKSFLYTGNSFATSIVPEQTGLASGKAASAYLIELASQALKDSAWYYADERLANGKPVMTDIDGEAHGEAFYKLATSGKQEPWNYTFVKGTGYIKFPDIVDREWTPIKTLFAEIGKEGH